MYFSTKKVVNKMILVRSNNIGNPALKIKAMNTIVNVLAYFPTIPKVGPVKYFLASLWIIAFLALQLLRHLMQGLIKKFINCGLNVRIM